MLISISGAGKSFGAERIFENLSLTVEDADRIALIGPNGAGKSTLLAMIAGELEPDEGTVDRRRGLRIGYFHQNSGLESDGTIGSELRGALSAVFETERAMNEAGEALAKIKDHASDEYRECEERYHRLQLAFDAMEGYQAEVKINTVLTGMGFSSFGRETPVATMSGGERTRLALAKILLEEPELLILDEATNHLDFKMLMWLEEYLAAYRGAILAVSHDRYFLDRVTKKTWEVEGLKIISYPASYTGYQKLREERIALMEKEYDRYQNEVARLSEYVDRNIARASTAQSAKSRLRMIEHLEEAEKPLPPEKPPVIRFSSPVRPVKDVLDIAGLTLSVGEGEKRKTLFRALSLHVMRGEKIAVIGDNGVGKSSLLKALAGLIQPDAGRFEWGRNTRVSYYEQDDGRLSPGKTALDELWDRYPRKREAELRTLLGGLRLSGDEVYKPVKVLSGGEKARLKLALLMLEEGNVLMLDEPTNHLDIGAKEALDRALSAFDGTILIVSHDRYLLNRLPTRIVHMSAEGVESFEGGFDAYMELQKRREAEAAGQKPASRAAGSEAGKEYFRSKRQRSEEAAAKRRAKALEEGIAAGEARMKELEAEIADPETASDFPRLSGLLAEMEALRTKLDQDYEEWENILCS
ncbi:MAG TPA: ABC-F family ATP-binding cassette domain-containing protein [Candidatus Fimivivens faecavium]|nr:ABC-F family ATP-binding cassette domain-containing protein [Candidatus Fimivivens faecavium]